MEDKKKWVMQMPIQDLVKLTDYLDHSELDTLEQPVVMIFSTDDNEFSVTGFQTLEEAKKQMEDEHDPSEGYTLEEAYFEGKEMTWTEVKTFDFREKKV